MRAMSRIPGWQLPLRKNWDRLTPKETEVLELIAEGLSVKEIGTKLNIAEHTVETHRASIHKKVGGGGLVEMLLKFYNLVKDESKFTKVGPRYADSVGVPAGWRNEQKLPAS